MSFEGKVAVITGSSSGLGQDTALLFATKGAKVTIHGQNPTRINVNFFDFIYENILYLGNT